MTGTPGYKSVSLTDEAAATLRLLADSITVKGRGRATLSETIIFIASRHGVTLDEQMTPGSLLRLDGAARVGEFASAPPRSPSEEIVNRVAERDATEAAICATIASALRDAADTIEGGSR